VCKGGCKVLRISCALPAQGIAIVRLSPLTNDDVIQEHSNSLEIDGYFPYCKHRVDLWVRFGMLRALGNANVLYLCCSTVVPWFSEPIPKAHFRRCQPTASPRGKEEMRVQFRRNRQKGGGIRSFTGP
jgi:hypothetical protein